MTSKLLPCPFCGGAVEMEKTESFYSSEFGVRKWWGVVCRSTKNRGGTCGIQSRPAASEEAATARWNMRAPLSPDHSGGAAGMVLPKCESQPFEIIERARSFVALVAKCVRNNGEYAPLHMQEMEELDRDLKLYRFPPEPVAVEHLELENKRLQRLNDDLSASVKYWFNAKKQSSDQAKIECDEADNTPYQPKGEWSFERLEGGEIVIRSGKDWTVIKSGDGPIYEQFLYRFCEYQMKSGSLALPEDLGKQSNLKDTQYAMGWNACLDKLKELNQ